MSRFDSCPLHGILPQGAAAFAGTRAATPGIANVHGLIINEVADKGEEGIQHGSMCLPCTKVLNSGGGPRFEVSD